MMGEFQFSVPIYSDDSAGGIAIAFGPLWSLAFGALSHAHHRGSSATPSGLALE